MSKYPRDRITDNRDRFRKLYFIRTTEPTSQRITQKRRRRGDSLFAFLSGFVFLYVVLWLFFKILTW